MATIYKCISSNLVLKAPAKITVIVAGKQDYSNPGAASQPWRMYLNVNGNYMKDVSGAGGVTDTPVLIAGFTVKSAQTLLLEVFWWGDASILLKAGTAMTAIVSYK